MTTAAIRGTVRAADGTDVDGTRVTVVSGATGFSVAAEVRYGRFLVQGLEVGGPYSVTLERLGFHPERRDRLYLSLGEALALDLVLRPMAIPLETLSVTVARPLLQPAPSTGTGTTISDSLLRRLPTLNRDLYDFVRLVPQVSTRVGLALGGLSGGGVGLRFNDFLIDGSSERTVSGHLPRGGGARSVPLDAVKEYQVLLSPYDVRYGDFAGALVNTVTRSGSNEWHGSGFAFWRNDGLARGGEDAGIPPFERWQYGFSLGGPIVRDRLHFFLAPEIQALTSPAPGPFLGQPPDATPPVPVTPDDLARLDGIMRGHGLVAGSGGPLELREPQRSVFGRLDLALPKWDSRAVIWENHSRASGTSEPLRDEVTFSLSTYERTTVTEVWSTGLQLHTALGQGGGGHNELLVSHRSARVGSTVDVRQPIVMVRAPNPSGGLATIIAGTHERAQGGAFTDWKVEIRDNLTLPLGGAHLATVGVEAEYFRSRNTIVPNRYGTWTFSSLDSLESGLAERYEIRRDFGTGTVPIRGAQYAAYAADEWRVSPRFSVTVGVRADLLDIEDRAPHNPVVDSIFRRRTDEMLRPRVHLSPRLGFEWNVSGSGGERLRGGVGIFTGRPPVGWLSSALTAHGVGVGVLRCGDRAGDSGPPPAFEPDYRQSPTACAGGPDLMASPRGEVNLLDPSLGMARTLRASLAYDRELPGELFASGEALITRSLSDFLFVNLNLEGPQGTDGRGRVLYGAIGPTGVADPALRSPFAEVIDLRNTSRSHSLQLTARLEKRISRGTLAASYTYSRARDVQTPIRVNVPGTVNWESRAVSGRHDDLRPGISGNDIPHRIILTGAVEAPWRRWPTLLSFYYVGESGSPFTYRASGTGGRGDLNADGSPLNDPIYVPRDVFDPGEISFGGPDVGDQQEAFERFVDQTSCLRRQRGRILEPNSCREPWSHTSILSLRQAIPVGRGALEAQLDLFNVLNLLNAEWGLVREARPGLLQHIGQTPGPPETAQPIFRFNSAATEWRERPAESAFQLQLALRYRF